MRDVVRHEPHLGGVEAGERGGEEVRGAARVAGAQLLPVPVQARLPGRDQGGVVGVRHPVEVLRA